MAKNSNKVTISLEQDLYKYLKFLALEFEKDTEQIIEEAVKKIIDEYEEKLKERSL